MATARTLADRSRPLAGPPQFDVRGKDGAKTMSLTDVHQLTIGRHQVDQLFQRGYTPLALLALFDRDLGPALDSHAGVGQDYTIREHVLMVLGLFDYDFSHRPLPGTVSPTFMRLFLLLHDIGKPAAIARGNKHNQHAFNTRIAGQVPDRLNYPRSWIDLAQSVAARDPLGRVIARGEIDAAVGDIRRGAEAAGSDPLAYTALVELYFCCDAGSYTVQGGGKTGLDRHFIFDPANRRMDLAERARVTVDAVAARFADNE